MPTSLPGEGLSDPRVRSSAGFSLFELILVMLLLGLVLAVALPSFSRGLRSLELETTGRDLVTLMKKARSEAISQQRVFRVILQQEPESQAYGVFTNDYGEELQRNPLPEGVSIENQGDPDVSLWFSFYPNGRSSGGTFQLRSSEGRTLRVDVHPVTGLARVVDSGREPND